MLTLLPLEALLATVLVLPSLLVLELLSRVAVLAAGTPVAAAGLAVVI